MLQHVGVLIHIECGMSALDVTDGHVAAAILSDHVHVTLMSGRSVQIAAKAETPLNEVKLKAQDALQTTRAVLLNSTGELLNTDQTMCEAGVQPGDVLTLQVQQTEVASNRRSFAARLGHGSVVTWGWGPWGGESQDVQPQLRSVRQIQASEGAFAAILCDGRVVTWGDWGKSSWTIPLPQDLCAKHIQATQSAFAAILADESVVTWGNSECGGDSLPVHGCLKNVKHIQATPGAFAAILDDGSVVTWGCPLRGGDSSMVQERLVDVQQIQGNHAAFAAILGDGSVVAWGEADEGGDSSGVAMQLDRS